MKCRRSMWRAWPLRIDRSYQARGGSMVSGVSRVTAAALALLCNASLGQSFPDKPVTMITGFPAGGSVDLVARAIAQHMSDAWKQPVIVSNRPGASGNIGA